VTPYSLITLLGYIVNYMTATNAEDGVGALGLEDKPIDFTV